MTKHPALLLSALALVSGNVQAQVTCAMLQPATFSKYFAQAGTSWEKYGKSTRECVYDSNKEWTLKAILYPDLAGGGISATQQSIKVRGFRADSTDPAAALLQQRFPDAWAGLRGDRFKNFGDDGEYYANAHVYTFGNDKDAIMVRIEKPEKFGPITPKEQQQLAQFGIDTMRQMAAQAR